MNFNELFTDKTLKPKEKTTALCHWVLENASQSDVFIDFAKNQKDPVKATCIEALEFATKFNPEKSNYSWFAFAEDNLSAKSPRIKWESAKVIGNMAHLHSETLQTAIIKLLDNAKHEGTVVRWSAAYALGEILKLKTKNNFKLIPVIETICDEEEKNSIKKIYNDALKKTKK